MLGINKSSIEVRYALSTQYLKGFMDGKGLSTMCATCSSVENEYGKMIDLVIDRCSLDDIKDAVIANDYQIKILGMKYGLSDKAVIGQVCYIGGEPALTRLERFRAVVERQMKEAEKDMEELDSIVKYVMQNQGIYKEVNNDEDI